jgi:hypothetical protein
MNLIKNFIPEPIKKIRRDSIAFLKRRSTSIKRNLRKYERFFSSVATDGYIFVILCVKKTVYANMVIENINSLHYLNPNHKVIIYCDSLCAGHLNSKKNDFNYSNNVDIRDVYGVADKPWQNYKIEAIINASKQGAILTDADGIWHQDPVVDKQKVTLLVLGNKISKNKNEKYLVEKELGKPDWVEFNHYVTGFVSIPPLYMTDKLAQDMRDYNRAIFYGTLNFIAEESARNGLRRLSEELSVNLALQSNFPMLDIVTLKTQDGPGSQQSLQSLYYGCCNEVNE